MRKSYAGAAVARLDLDGKDIRKTTEPWHSGVQSILDNSMGSTAVYCRGNGPVFDFHQQIVESLAEPHMGRIHPVTACKLALQSDVLPKAVASSRAPAHERDNLMSCVDSHGLSRRREWLPVDEKPHSARSLVADRTARRWDAAYKTDGPCATSQFSRSERIQLLKSSETGRKHLEDTPGVRMSSRRAYRERLIRGQEPATVSYRTEEDDTTRTSSSRVLHIKVARQLENCDVFVDDSFSKAVENHRNTLASPEATRQSDRNNDCLSKIACLNDSGVHPEATRQSDRNYDCLSKIASLNESDVQSVSERQEYPRLSPRSKDKRALKLRALPTEEMTSTAGVPGCLSNFASALDEQCSSKEPVSLDKAELFVKLSGHLQSRAYVLRADDSLKALRLIARSVELLELKERRTQYDVEKFMADSTIANASKSVREAMEQVLAAVVGRISAAEAPYLAEALFTMVETRSGRQEFLNAMLGHMSWLLAAKPRTFSPPVIARIMWAVGRMQVEKGADDALLCILATEGNRRSINALQARLMEVLDTFLENDIGTLALDPTGGDLLGDTELRRVLHRAGRLQVGLKPESLRCKADMQRLVAKARDRLFLPYQAEVLPFMRDYCEKLLAPFA